MDAVLAVGSVAGALGAACIAWVVGRARLAAVSAREQAGREALRAALEERLRSREEELLQRARELAALAQRSDALEAARAAALAELAAERAGRAQEQQATDEKLLLVQQSQEALAERFKALSYDALQANSQSFLEYARAHLEKSQEVARVELDARSVAIDGMVAPLRDALQKVDGKLAEIDQSRERTHGALSAQLRAMTESQELLRQQTERLVGALRAPNVRGRWGEVQLKRVVELAGMVERCDFVVQQRVEGDGGPLRPDMVVHLPGQKQVVVDSKVPLQAYLEAIDARDDATRHARLAAHAADVRRHVRRLSEKSYAAQFDATPEFVVMFIPGEAFLYAAMEKDPELTDFGATQNVILATPTTLIALLRAVATGWRQEQVAKNALELQALGRELHDRLQTLVGHFTRLGDRMGGAVDAYNAAMSSFESRVLVSARKFRELGTGGEAELEELRPTERVVRQLDIPALSPGRRGAA
jgi:DNA recombination protein RmuC